jgi:hypothetical protein
MVLVGTVVGVVAVGSKLSCTEGKAVPLLRPWTLPRPLASCAVCQALRIVTFSVTQLPGPSFHCRAAEPSARRAWPEHWSGHLVVDVGRQVSKSCGDLIFSSHTTFMLVGQCARKTQGRCA